MGTTMSQNAQDEARQSTETPTEQTAGNDRAKAGNTTSGESAVPATDTTPPVPVSGCGVPEPTRADLILKGLGYCGHYLRFHSGSRSGREPILSLLHCMGGTMSQQELGSRFELKPGSLSEVLAKIETAGLIERTRDPRDRRQLFIHLTEAGEQEAQRALAARRTFREQAFTNLTTEEQDQLIELLGKIRTRWEELAC